MTLSSCPRSSVLSDGGAELTTSTRSVESTSEGGKNRPTSTKRAEAEARCRVRNCRCSTPARSSRAERAGDQPGSSPSKTSPQPQAPRPPLPGQVVEGRLERGTHRARKREIVKALPISWIRMGWRSTLPADARSRVPASESRYASNDPSSDSTSAGWKGSSNPVATGAERRNGNGLDLEAILAVAPDADLEILVLHRHLRQAQSHRTDLGNSESAYVGATLSRLSRRNPTVLIWAIPSAPYVDATPKRTRVAIPPY